MTGSLSGDLLQLYSLCSLLPGCDASRHHEDSLGHAEDNGHHSSRIGQRGGQYIPWTGLGINVYDKYIPWTGLDHLCLL